MEKLFGLEMASIAGSLSAALILVIAGLGLLALRRPVFFKLGLRPIPRRKAQSTLIVLGLMLATLIITAAFITGDTLSHTIRTWAIEGMGEMDEADPGGRWNPILWQRKRGRLVFQNGPIRGPGGPAERLPAGGPASAGHQ